MRNHSFVGCLNRWARACRWHVLTGLLFWTIAGSIMLQPALAQTACSPSISGSTGAQGVLDPTNTNASLGLVWPAGAVQAQIAMDTGLVTFYNSTNSQVGTASLPGVDSTPAFPNGELNFTAVHIPAGDIVGFNPGAASGPIPIILLSCQDVVLDGDGSTNSATNGTINGGSTLFQGGNGSSLPGGTAGFGPRLSSNPAPGSLYPPIGGGGGNGGASAGGNGGAAVVIAAAGRITVNGIINVSGSGATSPAQGGAGGSVRLAALLTEGIGNIATNGGNSSPGGPIEIQAFLQDLFTGTTSTVPIRGNAPVQPIPSNLPVIDITQINTVASFPNTGSLTAPDVTLPTPPTLQIAVAVSLTTQHVPDGTILTVRAVGIDGSAVTAAATVSSSAASANLTLNAGTTYQIAVTPSTSLLLSRLNPHPFEPAALRELVAQSDFAVGVAKESSTRERILPGEHEISLAEQWMKAFGVNPELAKDTVKESSTAQLLVSLR